jgi:two-component system sensor histidine kinase/response regulator
MTEANILVIDDEPGIREGCKRALTLEDFFVETAQDGEQALSRMRSGHFDLALIDVMMPGISGIDLISLIHQHDPDIVCIIITGYATIELAVTAIKRGAYDFLTKPFTTDDLLLVVNQGLERRKLTLEAKRLQTIEAEAQQLAEEKARLEELDRAKVAFMRLVTHELQAPISAISTYLDLILNEYIPSDQYREYLERAQERAREQLALISDLLEFGRLKEVKVLKKAQLVQLELVLESVVREMNPRILEKDILLTKDIQPHLPPVLLPSDQVKSIWTNLISNAIKYTPNGGSIQIILCQEDAQILGKVRDTGIGIPTDAEDKLFSEFFRANNAKDMNIPGTGLGLAIVKHIIDNAGGRIWFESELNKGTTFSFLLPVGKEQYFPIDTRKNSEEKIL